MLASPSLIMGGLRVPWGQEEPFSVSRAGSKMGSGGEAGTGWKICPRLSLDFSLPDPQGTNAKK